MRQLLENWMRLVNCANSLEWMISQQKKFNLMIGNCLNSSRMELEELFRRIKRILVFRGLS